MKRFAPFIFVAALLLPATGCGGPDSLMKEQISLMNEMATAMEKKDTDKIKAIGEKLKANSEKLDALKLSDEEKKKLFEKYGKELAEAGEKMGKAVGADFLKGFGGGMPTAPEIHGGVPSMPQIPGGVPSMPEIPGKKGP